ncbi:hypothetical protein [Pelotomaculum propionicicum]|uniref:CobQ/CobB/MinD/ParA nucleotide binding domain-containing protein n=1 Tax=Pelotomaculum propionicicum TaxID=258475 RepID=A0A4Y7RT77_9FIRM|nr:hypothetical protein [Pelotomaculum propionicicum]NLI12566.1 hypothetical protein [Peptococcaceae bacterium]TEB12208.1 hypothetical protein Pmgp_01099 [Pelotomaculum propionicicum]
MTGRIVEAYIGEYAAGKSESAINRALELARQGRKVALVDLDIVEPFYTLRPLQKELATLGLDVIAWQTGETMGLGEAGTLLKPEARWALKREGDIILDIGYGVDGARTLNLLEGAVRDPDLKVFAVINICRPMTSSVKDIVAEVSLMGRVDGLINNSHLAGETTVELVQKGARMVAEAASILDLPVVATLADTELAEKIGPADCMGNPVRPLERFMPRAFW